MIWSHRAFFLSSVRNHLTENRLDVALKYSVKASARTQNSERILVMNFVIACVSGLAQLGDWKGFQHRRRVTGGEDNNLFAHNLNETLQFVLLRTFKNKSTTFEKLWLNKFTRGRSLSHLHLNRMLYSTLCENFGLSHSPINHRRLISHPMREHMVEKIDS